MEEVMFAAARDGDLQSLKTCVSQLTKDEARRMTSTAHNCLTPLVIACRNGHLAEVEFLLDECGADIELVGAMGRPGMSFHVGEAAPLWWAAAAGHLSIVQCLVSRGANVNSVSPLGRTAVQQACWNGDLPIVKYLVESGADVKVADGRGRTCLMKACRGGHSKVANYVLQQIKRW